MSENSDSPQPEDLEVNDEQAVTDSKRQFLTLPPSGQAHTSINQQGSSDNVSMYVQAGSFGRGIPCDNDFPTGPVTGPIQQPSSTRDESSSDEETVFEVVPMTDQRVNDLEEVADAGIQERIVNRQFRDNRLLLGNDGSQGQSDPQVSAQESFHVGINSPTENRTNRAFVSSGRHDLAIPEQQQNNTSENPQHENHDSANQNNDTSSDHQENIDSSNALTIANSNIGSSTDSKITIEQSRNVKNNDQASFRPTLTLRLADSDKSDSTETSSQSSDESTDPPAGHTTVKAVDDVEASTAEQAASDPTSPTSSETQFVVVPMQEEQNINAEVTGDEQRLINTLDSSFGQSLDSATDIYSAPTEVPTNNYPTGPFTSPVQQPASTDDQTHIASVDARPCEGNLSDRPNRAFVSDHVNVPHDDTANIGRENNDSAISQDEDTQDSSQDEECQFIVVPGQHHDYSTESCNLPHVMAANNYPTNENIILAHPEHDIEEEHPESDSSLS